MKLSLGPVLYYWKRDALDAFYREAAMWPVDIVYLGEAVCSRRHEYRLDDWLRTAEMLAGAGKEVVLSSQALIESESDLKALRRFAGSGRFKLEANDMGAVRVAGGRPFVAGPHLNTYNRETLDVLAEAGAMRWVMPVEMSRTMLAAILADQPRLEAPELETPKLETEVFAHGRLPLAFSARCFTARRYNLPKDDCQFRCLKHPEGLLLNTREGQPFLTINGTQTQSASLYNLVTELADMQALGVAIARISPHPAHTARIVELFRACLDGRMAPAEGATALAALMPAEDCDGYWHGRPGIEHSSNTLKKIA